MADATLSLAGICAGYPGRTVLDGVDLEVATGLTFLVGENGAGKTALFRLLLGLVAPSSGTVRIAGKVLRRRGRSHRDLLQAVGYLPQDFRVPPHMRVGDLLMYLAWLRGVASADVEVRAHDALDQVGLAPRWSDRLGALSGGMLRRVGVAQAIVTDPRVVLLDEPTVGLDPASRIQFRALVTDLAARDDRLVVCSTHLLEEAATAGGTLVALHHGRVAYVGPTAELLRPGDDTSPRGMTPLEGAFLRLVGDDA